MFYDTISATKKSAVEASFTDSNVRFLPKSPKQTFICYIGIEISAIGLSHLTSSRRKATLLLQ